MQYLPANRICIAFDERDTNTISYDVIGANIRFRVRKLCLIRNLSLHFICRFSCVPPFRFPAPSHSDSHLNLQGGWSASVGLPILLARAAIEVTNDRSFLLHAYAAVEKFEISVMSCSSLAIRNSLILLSSMRLPRKIILLREYLDEMMRYTQTHYTPRCSLCSICPIRIL